MEKLTQFHDKPISEWKQIGNTGAAGVTGRLITWPASRGNCQD